METKEDAAIFTIILREVEKRLMLSEFLFQKSRSNCIKIYCIISPDTASKMIWKKSGNISTKFGTWKTDQVRKKTSRSQIPRVKISWQNLNYSR